MLATLQAKLIGAGMLLALLLGAYAWAHHQGAQAQKTDDAAVIARKDQALQAASASLASAGDALRAASAATQAAAAAAAEVQRTADAAKAVADQAKLALTRADAAWQARFKAAQAAKGCETLQEQLCESVMDY